VARDRKIIVKIPAGIATGQQLRLMDEGEAGAGGGPPGHLYVVDALAGSSGLYRLRLDAPRAPELMLAGGALIGLAFDPHGGIALATSETVYRLGVPLRGLLPLT